MGKGRELGLQLRQWIDSDSLRLDGGNALANRLIDALGAEESLRGPVRDLATQPLLLRVLQQQGSPQRSAIQALTSQLAATYTPQVLAELIDLLEAAAGIAPVLGDNGRQTLRQRRSGGTRSLTEHLTAELRPLGPGLALAAATAPVLFWGAGELERWVFDPWGWSSGVTLVAFLALLQLLALAPLRRLKRTWPLRQVDSGDPRQAWCWITAPWIHTSNAEAALNLLLLLVLLGPSPLPLSQMVLRYALTSLATMGLAVLAARRWGVIRSWDGASGPIAALIGMAATLSLLQWRVLSFQVGDLAIPAWVLLVVVGALQLGWQLPRRDPEDSSRPVERLWSSPWWWGSLLGAFWALITRGIQLSQMWQASGQG